MKIPDTINQKPRPLCNLLDDYVNGDLTAADEAGFERHLSSCPKCSRSIDEQRWIDELLTSPEANVANALQISALVSIKKRIAATGRRRLLQRRATVAAVAGAVVIALASGFLTSTSKIAAPTTALVNGETAASPERLPNSKRVIPITAPETAAPQVEDYAATFQSSSDVIAIPMASEDKNVSIVKLYPTLAVERRWRRELYANAGDAGQDGG